MARNIVAGTAAHTFKHDLESFFWVLLYLLMLPSEEKGDHAEAAARSLEALEENNPRRVCPVGWQRILPKTGSKRSRNFASSPSDATLDPIVDEESRPSKKKGSRK
jgi:hypothetical protein